MKAADWPYSTWPESKVVRVDKSPMNPKIKIAQLTCGHDVYRNRAPRVGATIICPGCAEKADRKSSPQGEAAKPEQKE